MRREDYIWVAIRVLGLYLIVQGIIAFPSLLVNVYLTVVTWDWSGFSHAEEAQRIFTKIAGSHLSRSLESLAKVLLFGCSGVYFLKGGTAVFNLVNKRNPLSDIGVSAEPGEGAQPPDRTDAVGRVDRREE